MKNIFLIVSSLLFVVSCNPAKTKLGAEFFGEITVSLSSSTLTVSNSQVATSNSVNVLLRLKDQNGAAYVSTKPTITFSKSGGTSVGTLSAVTNLGDGTYTATFSGVNPGTPTTIRAQVDGQELTSSLPTVQVITGNYSLSNSLVTVSAGTVTSSSTITATLIVKDVSNSQLPDGGLTVAFSHSGGTSTGNFSAITDNLNGTYTATLTGVTVGSATDIHATIGGATVTSAAPTVTVSVGAATKLAFVQEPTAIASGSSISPSVTVRALDANNNFVSAYAADIVVSIDTNPSGGTLSGTLTRTPSSGISTFNDLSLNYYGTGYRLSATSGSLTAATSAAFNVTATAVTYDLPFTSITTPVYTTLYTSSSWSNMEFVGDLVRLTPTVQTDTATPTGTMTAGTASGVVIGTLTDGVNSGLKLGNGGGCNGGSADCAKQAAAEIYELNSSWTPQWSNVVGYWKLNGSGSIGNAANVTATVGSNGSAVNTNGTGLAYQLAQVGSAGISFDGVDDSITVPNYSAINTWPNGLTIQFWAKSNSSTDWGPAHAGLVSKRDIFTINQNNIGKNIIVYIWIGSWIQVNHAPTTIEAWNHYMITYDNSILRFYVNGAQVNSSSSAGSIVDSAIAPLTMGSENGYRYMSGSLDEVALWNKALTATEVGTIYDRQKSAYSGTFTSRIMDAKSSSSWTTLSWIPTLPFFKELPDYSGGAIQNESNGSSGYTSLVGSGGTTATNDLMTGIVGLWHFNEAAGTTGAGSVKDDSGQGNHGTPFTTTFGAQGKVGTGVEFNGTVSSYISAGNPANLQLTTGTTSAWFKTSRIDTFDRPVLSKQYAFQINVRNGVLNITDWGTNVPNITGVSVADGQWHHVAVAMESGVNNGTVVYIDGVARWTSKFTVLNQTVAFEIGRANWSNQYFVGSIDEVAVWNRKLHANEIAQLYQRGASRIKYQVQSCYDSGCLYKNAINTPATWQGPDGSSGTYFSELNNNSIPLTGAGDVKATLPSMLFSTFTSPPANTQYFRYRAIFESDSGTAALWPELKSTTVDPIHYPKFLSTDTAPGNTIIGMNSVAFYELNAFTQILGAGGCSNGVVYNLGLSNTGPWKYWNGTDWVAANGSSAQANTAAALVASSNAALTAFATDVGRGSVFFKAFMTSDGTSKCELDNIQVGGNR